MARGDERFVSGHRNIVTMPAESATVIYKGDTVVLDGGNAIASSSMNDAGDAAANREACADHFYGIAVAGKKVGETTVEVDISNEAVFKLELQAAASLSFGTALEPYSNGGACTAYQFVAGTTSQVAATVEKLTSGTLVNAVLLQQKFRAEQS